MRSLIPISVLNEAIGCLLDEAIKVKELMEASRAKAHVSYDVVQLSDPHSGVPDLYKITVSFPEQMNGSWFFWGVWTELGQRLELP